MERGIKDDDKFRRLWDMLMLLSRDEGVSFEEINKESGISRRTAYRYFQSLRNVGFVIERNGKHYRIPTTTGPYNKLSDLLFFTEEEAALLSDALQALDAPTGRKQKLLKKIMAFFQSEIPIAKIAPRKSQPNIKKTAVAMEAGKQLDFLYPNSEAPQEYKEHLVEPFEFHDDLTGFWAYDLHRQENVFFRASRMQRVKITQNPMQHNGKHKPGSRDYFHSAWNGPLIGIVINMNGHAFDYMRQNYPLAARQAKRNGRNCYVFEGNVAGFEGVTSFLLANAGHVEIVSPLELKHYVGEKAKVFL